MVSYFCVPPVQFVQHIPNSQGKSSFLLKWLALQQGKQTLYGVSLIPIIFFEVNWCCQEQICLIVMKSHMLTKYFKCNIM